MDAAGGGTTILVELYSEQLESLKRETLTFSSFPSTIRAIKDRVEECYSIPACVQKIFYQDSEIPDCSSLESLYIRSGDTLRVTYPTKGDTKDVKEVLQWLHLLTSKLHDVLQENKEKADFYFDVDDPLYLHDNAELLKTLLSPNYDPVKCVTRRHFEALQGVVLTTKAHRQIIDLKIKCVISCPILENLEYICLRVCAKYAVNTSCMRNLVSCGELDLSIKSFLMKAADDINILENQQNHNLAMALLVILNISEIPEVQEFLSSRRDVIKQCFLAASTKFYSDDLALDVMIFLLSISRSQEAHENLLNSELIGDIIDLCKKYQKVLDSTEFNALRTYAGVFFAQIICGSNHLLQNLPSSSQIEIKSLMQQVYSFDPMEIRDYELQNGIYWTTFLKCVDYIYTPFNPFNKTSEFHHYSIGILLCYLHSALGRSEHIEVLVEENLMDFIVALPWNISQGHEDRAKCVVREIAKVYPVHPLSLSSLTKAKLAISTCGLKKIMEINSFQELV